MKKTTGLVMLHIIHNSCLALHKDLSGYGEIIGHKLLVINDNFVLLLIDVIVYIYCLYLLFIFIVMLLLMSFDFRIQSIFEILTMHSMQF